MKFHADFLFHGLCGKIVGKSDSTEFSTSCGKDSDLYAIESTSNSLEIEQTGFIFGIQLQALTRHRLFGSKVSAIFRRARLRIGDRDPGVVILEVVLVILGIAVVIAFVVVGAHLERKRREAFRQLAKELGLKFRTDDRSIERRYGFLDALSKGSKRKATICLSGTFGNYSVEAFEFHYETYSTDSKGNRTTHHHYTNHYVLEGGEHDSDDHGTSFRYPELKIYPETFLSKIGQAMGYEDIDFESIEFSKSFTVRSKDKKFAYDVCHTRMMEYLLKHKDFAIEIEGRYISLTFVNKLKIEDVEGGLKQLIKIRELFPGYIYDD